MRDLGFRTWGLYTECLPCGSCAARLPSGSWSPLVRATRIHRSRRRRRAPRAAALAVRTTRAAAERPRARDPSGRQPRIVGRPAGCRPACRSRLRRCSRRSRHKRTPRFFPLRLTGRRTHARLSVRTSHSSTSGLHPPVSKKLLPLAYARGSVWGRRYVEPAPG
jgi:hypothetical protein